MVMWDSAFLYMGIMFLALRGKVWIYKDYTFKKYSNIPGINNESVFLHPIQNIQSNSTLEWPYVAMLLWKSRFEDQWGCLQRCRPLLHPPIRGFVVDKKVKGGLVARAESWSWGAEVRVGLLLVFLNRRAGITRNKGLESEKEDEEWI